MNTIFFCTHNAFSRKSMSMIYKFPILLACLMMLSCGDKAEVQTLDNSNTAIELPVTSQVMLPEKGVAYAFVPNDAAQWLSQIIILSEDGDLYQTTADGSDVKQIQGAKAKSIIGLNRPGDPGMFLAILNEGTIKAYVEVDDEGRFDPAPFSSPELKLKAFCAPNKTPTNAFRALNTKGEVREISASLVNKVIELKDSTEQTNEKISDKMKDNASCTASTNNDVVLFSSSTIPMATLENAENYIPLGVDSKSSNVTMYSSNGPKSISITDGITIPGVLRPQSVYAVSDNFGGPFNNGLILVSDADEPRFVIISADFARKTLAAHLSE